MKFLNKIDGADKLITDANNRLVKDADISNWNNKVDKVSGKGLSTEDYTTAEKNKLAGIANGATKNDTDANLKNRANHTGTQPSSTISDFASTVRNTVLTGLSTATNAVITTTDTVLSALGKLQKQISDNLSATQIALGTKSDKGHKHTKSEITDFPTSMPANGGNADTVDGKHYSDITNYVDSGINGLEIGGRNLILNSDFSQGLTNWTTTSNAINLEIGGGYRGNGLRLVITTTGTVTPRQRINLELMANDTLTGQIKVKTIQGNFSNMVMRVANQLTIPLVSVKQLDNDWELYTYQVTVSSPITLSNDFGFYNTTGEFIIDEIKLERGNKATDWTPATEDIPTKVSQLINDSGFLTINDLVPNISTGKSKPTDGSLIWYEEI